MNKEIYTAYTDLLRKELISALGCTEPIAIAYAAANARKLLGEMPQKMLLQCSGNVVKNVKGVVVPNSGSLKGVKIAAILGAVGGDPDAGLEVLGALTDEQILEARRLEADGLCEFSLVPDVPNLYIKVSMESAVHHATIVIRDHHDNIVYMESDGVTLFDSTEGEGEGGPSPRELLNIRDILTYASEVSLEDIAEPIERQIAQNTALSNEGLSKVYGAAVGRTLLRQYGDLPHIRMRARAAAGSDARMGGCALPAVINSGSGNQGITVSMPVIEYAEQIGASHESLCRALVVSNLVALDQKRHIGSLSAFCGAVCAACGAGAAMTFLDGGSFQMVSDTVTNTLGNVSGIICDGAKASCAAKISSAVDAAILAHAMVKENRVFSPGDGIIDSDVEGTIRNIGRVGRIGMRGTDDEILSIMTQ